MIGDHARNRDQNRFRIGELADHLGFCHAVTDDADHRRNRQRNHDPDRRDAAGQFELLGVADRHKAQEDVRHAEIAEPPRERGKNRQRAVGRGVAAAGAELGHAQVAGQRLGVFKHHVEAADRNNAEAEHADDRNRHDDALQKVGGARGEEAAERGIRDDDRRADEHGRVVIHIEKRGEQLAAGGKARRGIRHEEDDDDQSRADEQEL